MWCWLNCGTAYIILKNALHGCFFLVLWDLVRFLSFWWCGSGTAAYIILKNAFHGCFSLFFPTLHSFPSIFSPFNCLHNLQKCGPWLVFFVLSHPLFFPPIFFLFILFNSSSPPLWYWCKIVGTGVGVDESLGTGYWEWATGEWLSSLLFFSDSLLLLLL